MIARMILRNGASRPAATSLFAECGGTQIRCLSSRFKNSKKARTQVLEEERPREDWTQQQQPGSMYGQQQQQQQQQQYGAPGSTMPSYISRDKEQEQQGSQWDALGMDVVAHMRKVYGTMAVGIGIAAGASMFTMATPLIGIHPMIPGIVSIVPLMGIMYTSNRTHSPAMRAAMFAAFTGLSGMSLAPLCYMAMKMSPVLVPQALVITTGLFGAMTGLSLMAKPGSMLRLGVPLGAGALMLMACGIGGMFVPVTSAWYPILHNVYLYGGLGLFTLYIAYDTQKMIDEVRAAPAAPCRPQRRPPLSACGTLAENDAGLTSFACARHHSLPWPFLLPLAFGLGSPPFLLMRPPPSRAPAARVPVLHGRRRPYQARDRPVPGLQDCLLARAHAAHGPPRRLKRSVRLWLRRG
jgi:FtsH-binding integral membrane protein